jgi:hypothetical protein
VSVRALITICFLNLIALAGDIEALNIRVSTKIMLERKKLDRLIGASVDFYEELVD